MNLVLTKSISRFARNTTDCLEMVRSLTALGVNMIFEKENIDTRYMDSEFLLTILASLAENESRSFSDNNRWAIQKRFRDGTYRPARAPYGYDMVDGKYVINPTEAEIVRSIFDQFLNGVGPTEIAAALNRDKIPMKRDGEKWKEQKSRKWSGAQINAILKNIAYVGDALLQQSYHDQNFKTKANRGEYPQYLIKNRHAPIISRDDFLCAQKLIEQHRKQQNNKTVTEREFHILTGRMFCGCCGAGMIRASRKKGIENPYSWCCSRHVKERTYGAQSVLEEGIMNGITIAINKLRFMLPILPAYAEAADREWKEEHAAAIMPLEEKLERIRTEKTVLSFQWTQRSIDPAAYYRDKNAIETEERLVQADLDRIACPQAEAAKALVTALREDGMTVEEFLDHHREDARMGGCMAGVFCFWPSPRRVVSRFLLYNWISGHWAA